MQLLALVASLLAASPAQPGQVRIRHVVFARSLSDIADGGATADAPLRRTIFVLGPEEPWRDMPSGVEYIIARGATFTSSGDEPIDVPMLLVNHGWAMCRGSAKIQVDLTPSVGGRSILAYVLAGCPTEPNRYATWALEGPVSEAVLIEPRARPAGRADDPELRQLNALLKKGGAPLTEIRPRAATISERDARVQPIVIAARADVDLKAFVPRLFVRTRERAYVVLENEDDQTLVLVTLEKGRLERVQTERLPW